MGIFNIKIWFFVVYYFVPVSGANHDEDAEEYAVDFLFDCKYIECHGDAEWRETRCANKTRGNSR